MHAWWRAAAAYHFALHFLRLEVVKYSLECDTPKLGVLDPLQPPLFSLEATSSA
jgi:hypothetical protein